MTDWATLPLVLKPRELAPLLRLSVPTIQRKCAARRMDPAPISYAAGRYTWSRDAVRAWVERRLHDAPAPKRKPLLTVPPAVRVASQADVKATAASLLKGA